MEEQDLRKYEITKLKRELEVVEGFGREFYEDSGKIFNGEEYEKEDIEWIRHVGKLLGVVEE